MAPIEFYKKMDESWFLNPRKGFEREKISFEVRRDPLTGSVSRILPYRQKFQKTQISQEILENSRKLCPFCPDQIFLSTPQFIPEISSEGRIQKGEAVLFPNAFPYARYNWVIVLSKTHFLSLDQFSVEILKNGFLVAQDGIERLTKTEPQYKYCSINWNYLPQAGGGVIHPHIQVIIEDIPTFSHQRVLEGLRRYHMERGSLFWEDLISEEEKRGERYIGKRGNCHFLMAFSPIGMFGEVLIIFSHRFTLGDVTPNDWESFSEGLIRIFRFFTAKSIGSFNLAIFSGVDEEVHSWVYARLCPRMALPPWNTSDVNYLEKLHGEAYCIASPETICEELRIYFNE